MELSLKCALSVHFRESYQGNCSICGRVFPWNIDIVKDHRPSPVHPSIGPEKSRYLLFKQNVKYNISYWEHLHGIQMYVANLLYSIFFLNCFLKSSIMFSLHYQQYLLTDVFLLSTLSPYLHISVLLHYLHVLFQSFLPQQKEQVFLIDKWLLFFVIMQGTSKVAHREKFEGTLCSLRLSNVYV